MKKRMAAAAFAAVLGGALLAGPAQASDPHCGIHAVPDPIMCPVKCHVNWAATVVGSLPNVPTNPCVSSI